MAKLSIEGVSWRATENLGDAGSAAGNTVSRKASVEGGVEMKRVLRCASLTFVIATYYIGLAGCGGSGDGSIAGAGAVSSPFPTPAPSPVSLPPTTYSATVSWSMPLLNTDGTALTDIAGFRIYYGISPTNLTQSVSVMGAGVATHVVDGLASGTYYFAVAAVNSAGVESEVSNPVFGTVP
jgi:hypothetical protein